MIAQSLVIVGIKTIAFREGVIPQNLFKKSIMSRGGRAVRKMYSVTGRSLRLHNILLRNLTRAKPVKEYSTTRTLTVQRVQRQRRIPTPMLAARATARRASRLARTFATAVDVSGIKVAAVDNGQPTSAVTFLCKAGSRYEPKPGLSNVLRNFSFKV